MLSWMRWLTSWFWNIVNSGSTGGGFLVWFSDNWKSLTVFLIVVGLVVDWLVWLFRWRPYWLWLRKRQIIYEEVPVRKKAHSRTEDEVYAEDESAQSSSDAEPAYSESSYSEPAAPAPQDDLTEWDSTEDPYSPTDAFSASDDVPQQPAKKVVLNHSRPALGERMNFSDVDDGQQN